MVEDGVRPVRHLPNPLENPQQPASGGVSPLPPHGIRWQRPIFVYGNRDVSRPLQRSDCSVRCRKRTSAGAGSGVQSGGQRRRARGPS